MQKTHHMRAILAVYSITNHWLTECIVRLVLGDDGMLSDLLFTIDSVQEAYKEGLEVKEVINESLLRLENTGDAGIYLYTATEEELDNAVQNLGPMDFDKQPLWGIPFAVKDNIDVAGMPTTASCPEYSYVAKDDAYVVSLLKKAGAIVIGKTNLDQFATGLVGTRTPHLPPKNAINAEWVPGGSSSGSAVAVSHGQVCFSLGTDTAGSGRIPAALNNIVGLKPSLGALSNRGVIPACKTLDTVSIFALTVDDAQRVFECCAQYDVSEPYSKKFDFDSEPTSVETLTIAIPDKASLIVDDSIQQQAFEQAVEYWQGKGAKVISIDFSPFYEVAKLLYEGPWVAERLCAVTPFIEENPDAFYSVTRQIIESGKKFTASDLFQAQYLLQTLKHEIMQSLSGIDALCTPSMPGVVTVDDVNKDLIVPNSRLGTYTNFVNLLDLCAITVPGAPNTKQSPSSITLIAQSGHDPIIHRLANDYHRDHAPKLGATPHYVPNKKIDFISQVKTDHQIMNIAVVGAHMSGLPLNYQLTEKGGYYLYSAKTQPTYRLYQLEGKVPARPGLIQDANGVSIDVEVWALPIEKVGEFIAAIPAPLTIGTITLNNNQEVKGFLCESYALGQAHDISQYGGWKKYCLEEAM